MPDVLNPDTQALEGAGARAVARRGMPRDAPTPAGLQPKTRVSSHEEYEALNPGQVFLDPEGKERQKPYHVETEADFDSVPEGKTFRTPEGKVIRKPVYAPIDFTAQTLYQMSTNDTERRKALERSYPGKVKQDSRGQFYVREDDGTYRKPRNILDEHASWGQAAGNLAAAAAPAIGAGAGEALGSAGGSAVAPGPGTVAGAFSGAGVGAAAGQGFNDIILALSGVYDRSAVSEGLGLAEAGALGTAGSVFGRTVGAVSAGPVASWRAGRASLPQMANFVAGTDPEGLRAVRGMREKGLKYAPVTPWAKEAPHIQNAVEIFEPAFHTQGKLRTAATDYYEKQAGEIAGSPVTTKPTAAVSSRESGEGLRKLAIAESMDADRVMRATLEARKAGMIPPTDQRAVLASAADQARGAAQGLIDQGYADIRQSIDDAMAVAKSGHNSGELWDRVAQQLSGVKRGLSERASNMYAQADSLAEGILPNTEGLPELASQFANQLPEEFQRNQPGIVRQLRAMAGQVNDKGEVVKEPTRPTFGQLRNLRTQIRSNADFWRLDSDVKNGAFKYFARRVDEALKDIDAVPTLAPAVDALNSADQFYADNFKIFNSNQIKAIMRGLETGEPADPKVLFNTVVKEGHTDLTNRIRELVGPNLWRGVQAADLEDLMTNSRDFEPGSVDGAKFAREVKARHQSGLLETVHGRAQADQLLKQAQLISMLQGRVPVPTRPGDRMIDVVARARQAAEAAQKAAKQDPLATLKREMKGIENQQKKAAADARRNDILSVLYNPTVGASDAADRILNNEDMLLAAHARFGKTPEFELLRQVWVKRLLQNGIDPRGKLASTSPEVQNIMFPGVSLDQMKLLAKEMGYLMQAKGKTTGSSMSAFEKVEHPPRTIWGHAIHNIPFVGPFIERTTLGNYYGLVLSLVNNLPFLRWMEKGLGGDPAARQMVRDTFRRYIAAGGAGGATGAVGSYEEHPTQPDRPSGDLPRFRDGGQFTVGGEGGPDSQTVAFKASPGEVVTIMPQDGPEGAQAASEAAAARVQRQVRPPGGRQESMLTKLPEAMIGDLAVRSLDATMNGPRLMRDAYEGNVNLESQEGIGRTLGVAAQIMPWAPGTPSVLEMLSMPKGRAPAVQPNVPTPTGGPEAAPIAQAAHNSLRGSIMQEGDSFRFRVEEDGREPFEEVFSTLREAQEALSILNQEGANGHGPRA